MFHHYESFYKLFSIHVQPMVMTHVMRHIVTHAVTPIITHVITHVVTQVPDKARTAPDKPVASQLFEKIWKVKFMCASLNRNLHTSDKCFDPYLVFHVFIMSAL